MNWSLSKRFGSLGWRLFFNFTILLVFLTLGGGLVALVLANRAIEENAANELRVVSVTLARRVQKQLDLIESGLSSMEKHGLLVNELAKENPDRQVIETFLKARLLTMPLFLELAVFARDGSCVGATDPAWYEISAKKKAFFATGLKAFNFSELFTTEAGTIQLVSNPVSNGPSTKGVLVGQMNLQVIYELMDQTLDEEDSDDVFLLDSGLRYITTGKTGTEDLRESHLVSTPLASHLKEEFWVGKYANFDGQAVLGTSIRVPGRHWYVVLERSFDEVTKPVDGVRATIIAITIGVLVALILATFFMTRSITRPLNNLVEGAKRIADGDFKHRVSLVGGPDEVSFLAAEFERMRGRVEEYQSMLLNRLEVSERRLIESERLAAIGTLAATMAHEIRNPLNAMSLLLARLELSGSSDGSFRDQAAYVSHDRLIADMRGEVERLDRLVSEILDYAKPLHLNYSRFDLGELMKTVLDRYQGTFEANRIQVDHRGCVEGSFIMADQDKILQCLTNVLQNSIDAIGGKASSHEGRIEIAITSRDDGWIDLAVRDNGIGLPQGKEEKLFDLFFTTKERGTGLGLSTVRKIIGAHGGRIVLRPRGQKNGGPEETALAGGKQEGTEVVLALPAPNDSSPSQI